jgi:hypothetical protein
MAAPQLTAVDCSETPWPAHWILSFVATHVATHRPRWRLRKFLQWPFWFFFHIFFTNKLIFKFIGFWLSGEHNHFLLKQWYGFRRWGYLNSWMVYNGKSQSEMDAFQETSTYIYMDILSLLCMYIYIMVIYGYYIYIYITENMVLPAICRGFHRWGYLNSWMVYSGYTITSI